MSVRSPRKLFIFIICKIYFLDKSIGKKYIIILKEEALIGNSSDSLPDTPSDHPENHLYPHSYYHQKCTCLVKVSQRCVVIVLKERLLTTIFKRMFTDRDRHPITMVVEANPNLDS